MPQARTSTSSSRGPGLLSGCSTSASRSLPVSKATLDKPEGLTFSKATHPLQVSAHVAQQPASLHQSAKDPSPPAACAPLAHVCEGATPTLVQYPGSERQPSS